MSSLTISLVQTALFWENKKANLDMLEEKIMGIREKTEIVILPEMFNTGFSMKPEMLAETMDGETLLWMKRIAAAKKIILTGSLMVKDEGNYYNRLVWILPNGQTGFYDKRHLFAYGEEDKHYSPGKKRFIASVKGWKILLLVCYDLRFPVWSRQQMPMDTAEKNPEFDLIVYVANWPERRNHAWKTLLQARAIENQSYVAGVNRVGNDGNGIFHSGHTMLIDPLGEVLFTEADAETIFTHTLQKSDLDTFRTKLPFLKDGDQFFIQP